MRAAALLLLCASGGCVLLDDRKPDRPDGDDTSTPGDSGPACGEEVCNGADDDCDGEVDEEGDPVAWYSDADGDGWGVEGGSVLACTPPEGHVAQAGDCDDTDEGVHPDAEERCGAEDLDCDGDSEAGAVDMSVWYADTDGDGFGAGEALVACEAPLAYVAWEGDCDDADGATYPGADEVCDGVDNDCGDPDEGEAAVATFFGDDGAIEDWSARLGAGAVGAPVAAAFAADGTLAVCAGTWYVTLDVTARDFALEGRAGADATVLSGGGVSPVVAIDREGAATTISGVTLRDGLADDGGAVQTGHGGVTLTLVETRVVDNVAEGYGGGIRAYGGSLSLVDVVFAGNRAGSYGGAVSAYGADVSCVASAWSDAGASGNAAELGGGVHFWTAGWETLVSEGCDWTDNTPDDVYVGTAGAGSAYDFGQDATFTCDAGGC